MKQAKRTHTATQYWNAVAAELLQYGFTLMYRESAYMEDSFFTTYTVKKDGVTVLERDREEVPRLYLLAMSQEAFVRVTDEHASRIVFNIELREAFPLWQQALVAEGIQLVKNGLSYDPASPEVHFRVTVNRYAAEFSLRIPVDEVMESTTRDKVVEAARAALLAPYLKFKHAVMAALQRNEYPYLSVTTEGVPQSADVAVWHDRMENTVVLMLVHDPAYTEITPPNSIAYSADLPNAHSQFSIAMDHCIYAKHDDAEGRAYALVVPSWWKPSADDLKFARECNIGVWSFDGDDFAELA